MLKVQGYGPSNAKIAIVGEAPGREEVAKGKPFIGPSGRLLDKLLERAKIERRKCYVTNVVKERVIDFGALYEDTKRSVPSPTLLEWWKELQSELSTFNLNVIIGLGGEALRGLVGKGGIGSWRGSILNDSQDRKVLCTYHPAAVLHKAEDLVPIILLDLAKAKRLSEIRGPHIVNFNLRIDPTFEEGVKILRWLIQQKPHLSYDIETFGRHVRCIGFAWTSRDAVCIPFVSQKRSLTPDEGTLFRVGGDQPPSSHWEKEQETYMWSLVKEILEDEQIPKTAQNNPFDSTVLGRELGIHVRGLHMDTMLAHHACYAELGKSGKENPLNPSASGKKSLDFLTSIYTDIPRYSDYDAGLDSSTWEYNCKDCCVTWEVREKLDQELDEKNVSEFYKNHIEQTMFATCRMQNEGLLIDEEERLKEVARVEGELETTSKTLAPLLNEEELNVKSGTQMKELLYEKLKLPPVRHRKTGKITTDKSALEQLARQFPEHSNLLNRILDIRKLRDYVSNFLSVPLFDNRLYTSYNVAGTVNGRLSSSASPWGEGGNVQQIPKTQARRMIVAPKGEVLLKADLSQAEVRVVAWIAPIPYLIERFLDDKEFDIHRWNASNIYGIDEERVTKDKRSIGKAGVHGGNYGLGFRTAQNLYKLSYLDAKRSIEAYRTALPEVQKWWADIQQELHRTRSLYSLLGRLRIFFGEMGEDLYRSAYSFVPQATVVDIINRAIAYGEAVLSPSQPILQVHDEIVVRCPKEHMLDVARRLKNLLEYPLKIKGSDLPPLAIPAEISFGPNWWDQEEMEL